MADAGSVSVVGLIAGSSVVSAVVTVGVGWLRDKVKSSGAGDFAALYLAVALEEYAAQCSSMISESENFDGSDGNFGVAWSNLPKLDEYPAKANLEALGIKYAQPAMNFQIKVDSYRAHLTGLWEFDDEETIRLARRFAAELGVEALELSGNFRRARGLMPRIEVHEGWSMSDDLKTRKKRYDDLEREREQRATEREAALVTNIV